MTNISEIHNQQLSTLVCDYLICNNCGVIDRDYGRMKSGHCCAHCQVESEVGSIVFPISIRVLVDLVQQTYHSRSQAKTLDGPQGQNIGTILFYCSLREALLNMFISNNLRARNVDEALISRMLEDNKLAGQKFGGLFSSVVGLSWKGAVDELNRSRSVNYDVVSDLMQESAKLRNEFLHQGRAWQINRDLATRCIDSVGELVSLFVELHNEYTQPLLGIKAKSLG